MTDCRSTMLTDLQTRAAAAGVPVLDLIMITANMYGINDTGEIPRARMALSPHDQNETWQLILPLNNPASPFTLRGDQLLLEGESVAALMALENDDVVLTYLRAAGRSVTLNTYSRSSCIGCIFCPNIIEDAADATVNGVDGLRRVLDWLCADQQWPDLTAVEVITVCSGCFRTPAAAIRHMADLRRAAEPLGFDGRLHLLSSVLRDKDDLDRLAAEAGSAHLTLTLECFERRPELLKSSKASLGLDRSCEILADCADLGILGDFTYVAGLDPLASAVAGIRQLVAVATTFPRIQVYQAHNELMRQYRSADAGEIGYYIDLRREIEGDLQGRGLEPRSWENYRPLWYTGFAGRPVPGPRI